MNHPILTAMDFDHVVAHPTVASAIQHVDELRQKAHGCVLVSDVRTRFSDYYADLMHQKVAALCASPKTTIASMPHRIGECSRDIYLFTGFRRSVIAAWHDKETGSYIVAVGTIKGYKGLTPLYKQITSEICDAVYGNAQAAE